MLGVFVVPDRGGSKSESRSEAGAGVAGGSLEFDGEFGTRERRARKRAAGVSVGVADCTAEMGSTEGIDFIGSLGVDWASSPSSLFSLYEPVSVMKGIREGPACGVSSPSSYFELCRDIRSLGTTRLGVTELSMSQRSTSRSPEPSCNEADVVDKPR